jgi:hypothetical protein
MVARLLAAYVRRYVPTVASLLPDAKCFSIAWEAARLTSQRRYRQA